MIWGGGWDWLLLGKWTSFREELEQLHINIENIFIFLITVKVQLNLGGDNYQKF